MVSINKEFHTNAKIVQYTLDAGLNNETVLNAARLYIYSIMSEHTPTARSAQTRLCAKESYMFHHMAYLSELFPRAKFVYMARDPRAQVASFLKFDNKSNLIGQLTDWDQYNREALPQCLSQIGADRCLLVHYELLVTNVRETLSRLVRFLEVPWSESLMRHDQFLGGKTRIRARDKYEDFSKPVSENSLHWWQTEIQVNQTLIDKYASMYKAFGYDMSAENYDYLKNNKILATQ
jgi:protein-tyrosine sulfotransferase